MLILFFFLIMNPGGSRGNTIDFGPAHGHGDGDGDAAGGRRRMSSSDTWVWPPPPRIKNSVLPINNEGTCSCASQIPRQQQPQQQQRTVNINSLIMPVRANFQNLDPTLPADHSAGGHSSSSISYPGYHTVSPLPGNNPRPLRFLFCKELTYSDIKKRNKIILPRRDAEVHLPHIDSREGVRVYMEDKETKETWCFRSRYRITNNSKVHSLEGTRHFLQLHGLKAGDYIVIYKDDERNRYVIVAAKETREVLNGESSVTNNGRLIPNLGLITSSSSSSSPSSYMYLNQLSDFSVVDEMEEVAKPRTPYSYGNATWTGGKVSCDLERLSPLQTFKFFDFPIDNMF